MWLLLFSFGGIKVISGIYGKLEGGDRANGESLLDNKNVLS